MNEDQRKIFDLEQDKKIRDFLEQERKKNDDDYAIKWTERIVFAGMGLMGMTIAGTLIKIAIDWISLHLGK